jgi:hypothetical protein
MQHQVMRVVLEQGDRLHRVEFVDKRMHRRAKLPGIERPPQQNQPDQRPYIRPTDGQAAHPAEPQRQQRTARRQQPQLCMKRDRHQRRDLQALAVDFGQQQQRQRPSHHQRPADTPGGGRVRQDMRAAQPRQRIRPPPQRQPQRDPRQQPQQQPGAHRRSFCARAGQPGGQRGDQQRCPRPRARSRPPPGQRPARRQRGQGAFGPPQRNRRAEIQQRQRHCQRQQHKNPHCQRLRQQDQRGGQPGQQADKQPLSQPGTRRTVGNDCISRLISSDDGCPPPSL